jgi:hypothetical protein
MLGNLKCLEICDLVMEILFYGYKINHLNLESNNVYKWSEYKKYFLNIEMGCVQPPPANRNNDADKTKTLADNPRNSRRSPSKIKSTSSKPPSAYT